MNFDQLDWTLLVQYMRGDIMTENNCGPSNNGFRKGHQH